MILTRYHPKRTGTRRREVNENLRDSRYKEPILSKDESMYDVNWVVTIERGIRVRRITEK
jgi:hypothetical protein